MRCHLSSSRTDGIAWKTGNLRWFYCITLVFSSFNISDLFGVKDPIPDGLCSRVVYKFVGAGCNACYVGETCWHFSTLVREHLVSDRASHIFKHLKDSAHCRALCSADNFHVLDPASSGFSTQDKRGYSYSKRTTILESTITPCKSKTILLILTLSCFTSFHVVTIYHNWHCSTYYIIQLPTLCTLIK